MLSALGVQPTEEQVDEMMAAADTADGLNQGDGKIDMREFLLWYSRGLQSNRNEDKEDATDAFRVLARQPMDDLMPPPSPSGAPRTVQPTDKVSKEQLLGFLSEHYGLDYTISDLDEIFVTTPAEHDMTFEDFAKVLGTSTHRHSPHSPAQCCPRQALCQLPDN